MPNAKAKRGHSEHILLVFESLQFHLKSETKKWFATYAF